MMRSAGEQDTFAEEVWVGPSVHLSFDHLDAVDVAFDGAGAVGRVRPAVTAALSLRRPAAKLRSSRRGLAWAWSAQVPRLCPVRWQSISANWRTRSQVSLL
jgi:hypothetical protein